MKIVNEEYQDFLDEIINYSIIVRGSYSNILQLKNYLVDNFPDITFVYQKYSKFPMSILETRKLEELRGISDDK